MVVRRKVARGITLDGEMFSCKMLGHPLRDVHFLRFEDVLKPPLSQRRNLQNISLLLFAIVDIFKLLDTQH